MSVVCQPAARLRAAMGAVLLGAAAVGALIAGEANARQAPQAAPSANDESTGIVVTARRRGEKLDTIPLAVTAFTAKSLEARDIKSLTDVSNATPGFQFQNQANTASGRNDRSINVLIFRGLALSNATPLSSGGLLFVDGAPVIGATAPPVSEVERIEVLKGPQSAYFGRSTFSGAVNYVTKDPTFDFGGKVDAQIGNYGSNAYALSLNAPIVKDVLAVRISGKHDFQGGQYQNYADANQRLGDRETNSLTAQILFKPTANFRAKAFISYAQDNDGPPAQAAFSSSDLSCNRGGTYGAFYCGGLPNNAPASTISGNYVIGPSDYNVLFNNSSHFATLFDPHYSSRAGLKRDLFQADLRMDWELGGGYSLSSITAIHSDKNQNVIDLSFRDTRTTPNPYYGLIPGAPEYVKWLVLMQSISHDFSQELRLTSPQDRPLRWTAGANYFKAAYRTGTIYGVSPFGASYFNQETSNTPQTPAIFGGLYYDVTPKLTLSAEGRYQWDIIEQALISDASGNAISTPANHKTYASFSPRAIIDWKFRPNSTAYALFSRGYRPGGFNASLATLSPAVLAQVHALGGSDSYGQEKLDNYEAGIKTRFWHNRASLRLAGYIDRYSNGQVSNQVFYTVNGNISSVFVVQNLGVVDLKGFELEGDIAPIPGLFLSGSLGLAESKVKNSICSECIYTMGDASGANGKMLPGAPRWTWTLSAAYERPAGKDYVAFGRIDYRHRGRMYGDSANLEWQRATDVVDARLGARRGAFSLEAFVSNLFNNQRLYGIQGTDVLAPNFIGSNLRLALPDLRRFGLRGSFSF